ncbi:hypothetical protein ABGB07_38575 [Micromonosporaceae bacterium B7E4]
MRETMDRILSDLEEVGVRVNNVWDLVNTTDKYPEAVPILLSWLDRIHELPAGEPREKLREGIIRALSVPYARGLAAPAVARQFAEISNTAELGPRWVAGSALGVVADAGVADQVIEILLERSMGRAREMIFEAVPRIAKQRPDIIDAVRSLLDDETILPFVIAALGRLRDVQSRDEIARFLTSDRPLVNRQAKIALRRLDAELARRARSTQRN